MTPTQHLIAACTALVFLVFVVGLRMFVVRVREMRAKRIHPQAAATSVQTGSKLEWVQAADNFRNLFEMPVLLYALVAVALATGHTPPWLVAGAWLYVALRYVHSAIHCTYNKVMHRFAAFAASFFLLIGLWLVFLVTYRA